MGVSFKTVESNYSSGDVMSRPAVPLPKLDGREVTTAVEMFLSVL